MQVLGVVSVSVRVRLETRHRLETWPDMFSSASRGCQKSTVISSLESLWSCTGYWIGWLEMENCWIRMG